MKLIFDTSELINKVKNIAPTAEAKQTLMILGNMVFRIRMVWLTSQHQIWR